MKAEFEPLLKELIDKFMKDNYVNPTNMDRLIIENAMRKASILTFEYLQEKRS